MSDTQYVVVGACAYLTATNPLDGKQYKTLLYQGSLVPESATDDEIEHNLAVGLIAVLEDVPDGPGAPPDPGAPGATLEEPARNASTEEWRAYAIGKGATLEEIDGLKRDDLVEKFGTPPQ